MTYNIYAADYDTRLGTAGDLVGGYNLAVSIANDWFKKRTVIFNGMYVHPGMEPIGEYDDLPELEEVECE